MRRGNSNILSGALFIAAAALFLAGGFGLPMGTARRMGPGWFPVAVAALLLLMGGIIAFRGLVAANGPAVSFMWRPLLVISAALAAFIATLDRLGLAIAIMLTVIIASYAHPPVHLPKTVLYAVLLAAFCSLVFVRLLGLQMPIVGSWLTPWLGHWV